MTKIISLLFILLPLTAFAISNEICERHDDCLECKKDRICIDCMDYCYNKHGYPDRKANKENHKESLTCYQYCWEGEDAFKKENE